MGHLHKLLLISKLWFEFPDFGTSFKMLMIHFHRPWLLDPGVPWENRKAERDNHNLNLDFPTQSIECEDLLFFMSLIMVTFLMLPLS